MLGNWSYSVYLWHVPVYLAVMVGFAADFHPVSQLNPLSARLLLLATALRSRESGGTALHRYVVEIPIRHKLRAMLHLV